MHETRKYNEIIISSEGVDAIYRHCTTEDTVRRQRQLENCLLTLMTRKKYNEISVCGICGLAGVSRMAFYQYFDSKDDALDALLDHTLMDYDPFLLPGNSLELERFVAFWRQQKPLLDALRASGLEPRLYRRASDLAVREDQDLRRWFCSGQSDSDTLVVRFATQGMFSVILDWHARGFDRSPAQIAATLERILLMPLISGSSAS